MGKGDFHRQRAGGVRFIEAALKSYLEHFEWRMKKDFLHREDNEEISFPVFFYFQAEKPEKAILNGEIYQLFLMQ
jgi:CRISPR/Cas system-associated endonuclease Cas1